MIDIRDYDEAMLARFKHYYSNTHWINKTSFRTTEIKDNTLFEGKSLSYPLLTLRRVSTPYLYKETNSWSMSKTGILDQENSLVFVCSNYKLTYEVDVLSYNRDDFDELVIELQENLLRDPYLSFDSDDAHIDGISTNIEFEEIEDNTDVEQFQDTNPLYRATLTLNVRAYIYRKYRAITIGEAEVRISGEVDSISTDVLLKT